jgi:hypothetical protein
MISAQASLERQAASGKRQAASFEFGLSLQLAACN